MLARCANLFFLLVALACLGLVVAEIFVKWTVNATNIAILLGIAIVAMLAPKLESFSFGEKGFAATLRDEVNSGKMATVEANEQLTAKIDQIYHELQTIKAKFSGEPTTEADASGSGAQFADRREVLSRYELPEVKDPDDPQKGRFGGQDTNKGFRLRATVEQSDLRSDWCKVTLTVSGPPGWRPKGDVMFYVHHTFTPDHYAVTPVKGMATLVLTAWGAFTVGAIVDGAVPLELDLADPSKVKAPRDWQAR